MSRGRAKFRQSDLTRALKAALAGGAWRVEVDLRNEKIILIRPPEVDANVTGASEINEWDEVK